MNDEIDLNEVARITERRNAINAMDLRTARFVRAGKEIKVSDEQREEWKFTGLNNIDLAISLID